MANFFTLTEILFTILFVPHSCFKYHTKKPKDVHRLIYIYVYIIQSLILVGWGTSYQQINHNFIELQRIII